jgi:hypothetical protein
MVKAKQALPTVRCSLDICETRTIHTTFFESLEFKFCEDTVPMLTAILPIKLRGKVCSLDSGCTLLKWAPDKPGANEGLLTIKKEANQETISVYQKKIPLIDPFQWLKYKEKPSLPFAWKNQDKKVLDPENQAYIDILGSSLVSKIPAIYNSPHFCKFYGCFRAVADVYKYNLAEDLDDIRFTNWFWNAIENKEFVLNMVEKSTGRSLTLDEIKEIMKPDDEYLEDSDDDSDDSEDDDESVLEQTPTHVVQNIDLEEVSLDDKSVESEPILLTVKKGSANNSVNTGSTDNSLNDEYDIFIELSQMPIVVMYIEKCEGTLDELLETENTPIRSIEDELQWSAWIFQIIAALCQLQGDLRLTHNDLHTNNILWKKTDQEFLFYKDSLGKSYKIPTYGRIFTIIDYGRAIFSINNFYCISSDYQDGNNAAGQYNFGPLEDHDEPRVYPNKSFDLSRLSCSLVRGLFPYNPAAKIDGKVITREHGWEIRETNHPLFNLLWLWLRSEDGENILEKQDGSEKFPGFDLYIEIAHHVKDAVPRIQLNHPAMKGFLVSELPSGCKPIMIPV